MILTMCLGCLPYHQNWQVNPPPPTTCSYRMHDVYLSTILNVATDLLIVAIPLPTLWTMQAKLGRRIGLTILLCSGIFVMVAAVIRFGFTITGYTSANLNKYVNTNSAVIMSNALTYARWCQRETTVGIIAVNIPVLWTGLKPIFLRNSSSRLPTRNGLHPSSIADIQCLEASSSKEHVGKPRCGILTSAHSDMTLPSDKHYKSSIVTSTDLTSVGQDSPRMPSDQDTLPGDRGA